MNCGRQTAPCPVEARCDEKSPCQSVVYRFRFLVGLVVAAAVLERVRVDAPFFGNFWAFVGFTTGAGSMRKDIPGVTWSNHMIAAAESITHQVMSVPPFLRPPLPQVPSQPPCLVPEDLVGEANSPLLHPRSVSKHYYRYHPTRPT